MTRPPCKHCQAKPGRPNKRGLCWTCHQDIGIREQYPNGNSTPCPVCGYNLPSNPRDRHNCRKDDPVLRADQKLCPSCKLPMQRLSAWDKCSRCRGVNHKPNAQGTRLTVFRALGSEIPLPRPDLPNGGLLIEREVYDCMGLHDGEIQPCHRGYGESKRYRRKA